MSDDEKIRVDDKRKFDKDGNLKNEESSDLKDKNSRKGQKGKTDSKKDESVTAGAKKEGQKAKQNKETGKEKAGEEKKTVSKKDEKSRIEKEKVEAKDKNEKDRREEKAEEKRVPPEAEREPVDFIQFVLSLYTSAMINLGEVPDPASGKKLENYDVAKELIDIIAMLRDKTKGNLADEESKTLDELIFQGRMIYLKVTGRIKT